MEKKLPKVFANKIEKELNNNERVYYERNSVIEDEPATQKLPKIDDSKKIKIPEDLTINQKINKIFGSSRYVYKADVKIQYKDGNTALKKIIGRNKNELITMDNELIKISLIDNIEFSDN